MASLLLIIAALFCLMAAVALLVSTRNLRLQKAAMRRFNLEVVSPVIRSMKPRKSHQAAPASALVTWIGKVFDEYTKKSLLAALLAGIIGWYFLEAFNALMLALAALVFLQLRWAHKKSKFKRLIISQIPLLVDQLIRSLATGQSIEASMRLVAKNTPAPLGDILGRVIRATDLGAGLAESLLSESEAAQVKELQIIALSIRIGNKFGSSPKEMLQSVMQMIRTQEQTRRELQAMTGETKITAVILLLTPALILLYILVMNPGYLQMMTSDSSGIIMFRVAIGMQVFGAFLFWRMLKSI